MSYAILHADGKLIGVHPEYVAATQLSIPGISLIEMEGVAPDLNCHVWNGEEMSFVKVTSSILTKLEFLTRLSRQERLAARDSADPVVKDFMHLLDSVPTVDLSSVNTQQGIGYLAMRGILTSERVAQILSY